MSITASDPAATGLGTGDTIAGIAIERLVPIFAIVFGGAASWVAAFIADNVPDAPKLDSSSVAIVMATVFLGVIALAWKWLHGRQIPAIANLPVKVDAATMEELLRETQGFFATHADLFKGADGRSVSLSDVERLVEGKVVAALTKAASGALGAPAVAASGGPPIEPAPMADEPTT